MIAEPIQSTPYIPKPEYWQIIRKACARHGALLIFDEAREGQENRRADCGGAEAVMCAALIRGLNFKLTRSNILTLTPAMPITRDEMDLAPDIIEVCLGEVEYTA